MPTAKGGQLGACRNGGSVSLRKLIASPENLEKIRADLEAERAGLRSRRDEIERELTRAQRGLEKLSRALLDDAFDYDTVAKQSQEMKAERDRLQGELERADAECPKVDIEDIECGSPQSSEGWFR